MNRGVYQSSPVQQQMMGGGSGWWSLANMRPPSQETATSHSPLLPLPLASPPPWSEGQEQLPESWSQLLWGGLIGEEERCNTFTPLLHPKRQENWEDQMLLLQQQQQQQQSSMADVKLLPPPSPSSCVTSFNGNMLDFSSTKHSPEYNSSALKKARVQPQSTFKVRKEKLGDRITALHQLVCPFGKTDTASVLLEAIGYIRFLQTQIEALSSPYLGNGHSNTRLSTCGQGERGCIFPEDPGQLLDDAGVKTRGMSEEEHKDGESEPKKDLKSRGLCLVPLSCTLGMGSESAADFWAPTTGMPFR